MEGMLIMSTHCRIIEKALDLNLSVPAWNAMGGRIYICPLFYLAQGTPPVQ